MIGLFLALGLANAAPAAPPADSMSSSLPVASAEQQVLDRIGMIGKMLYDFDQAVWVGTDAMLAKVPRERLPETAGGWIVERQPDGALTVSFYGGAGDQRRIFFTSAVRDGMVGEERLFAENEMPTLTPVQHRMADAREIAVASESSSGFPRCAENYNSVIVPPAEPDAPISVYFLTPQTEQGSYPFGGHYRMDVDKAGKVIASRAFSKSCLNMAPTAGKDGSLPAMMFVTHLLDNQPTELHVYLSIGAQMPLAVSTPDRRLWLVEGTRVTLSSNDLLKDGERPAIKSR